MIPKPPLPEITRRGFVQTGGALFVSLMGWPRHGSASDVEPNTKPVAAWIEIRSDHSVLVRTGRAEIGTGMSAFYAQVVAEELNVRPESIQLLMGDTDQTPDGGYSAGFLGGAANLRKVAAYTYQALLALASKHLGVAVGELSVSDGVISYGGTHSLSYAELMQGQQFDLKIPVTGKSARFAPEGSSNTVAGLDWDSMGGLIVAGAPPTKPISQYKVVGTSFPMPGIPDKVTGATQWSCDVTVAGMLHARMVRPATLGSTLISVGELDKVKFPNAEILRKHNLLAVVAPDEWEAVRAAQAVAAITKWSQWSGLPASENLGKSLRSAQWPAAPDQVRGDRAAVNALVGKSAKTVAASYEQPYVKHAPIGPFVAVADVRPDGTATIWTHSSHSQALRARIAKLLGLEPAKVIVRWLDHAGQFGRATFGGDGAEADAAILSQMIGKPVRVQWTMQDDLSWSSATPAWFCDVAAGIDSEGRLTAWHSAFHSPHMLDARPLGALLAGMPAGTTKPGGFLATDWIYDKIPARCEEVFSMQNLAGDSPNGGLRGLIMRTPGQRQQNFALESLINEAAAAVGADPIEFRLQHTSDQRMIDVLKAAARASGWETRRSPHPNAQKTGTQQVPGRGVCLMRRDNTYWAGIAELHVTPASGVVEVDRFTLAVECGKVINPRQLDRCMKGGVVMGLSEALKEEVTFDRQKITSSDWSRYKILTMQETPEILTVQISRDDQDFGGGGEAPNALVPAAVAAAFFDATGVPARRIPLTPDYVTKLLRQNI